jgi:hypothetical protein
MNLGTSEATVNDATGGPTPPTLIAKDESRHALADLGRSGVDTRRPPVKLAVTIYLTDSKLLGLGAWTS